MQMIMDLDGNYFFYDFRKEREVGDGPVVG